jgi:hypothetical protein
VVRELTKWSDEVDEVIRGDLTAAAAYVTAAGGVVVSTVAPLGIDWCEAGHIGFTTSLGFPKKLERILADPRVAIAYHTREHGFSTKAVFVLAQGIASVNLKPSRERLESMQPIGERFVGDIPRGPLWDRLLQAYFFERVFVEIALRRIIVWPDLSAADGPTVSGEPLPSPASEQTPPKDGTSPRIDVDRIAGRIAGLPHRVIAYRGADGLPVVVPVELAGHDQAGLRLVVPQGVLPPGGRRSGMLAHAFRPQLVGLSTLTLTGWLQVSSDGAVVYAPHTSKGFVAPPNKKLLLVSNGLFAKYGMWQARRRGTAQRLERMAEEIPPELSALR